MACTWLGVDSHAPTAAMSAYLIQPAGQGMCGTCWRVTNAHRIKDVSGSPVQGIPWPNSKANTPGGMVVMINNACGADPKNPFGQCNQTPQAPRDRINSQSVLDLCDGTDGVQQFFGQPNADMGVATATQVDCSEWAGKPRGVKWQ